MSRESMNMGSSNNNIISQLKSTMNEFRQMFSGLRQEASSFFTSLHMPSGSVSGMAGGNVHPNQVAPNPVFNNAPSIIGMTESGNIVAAGPSASMAAGGGFSQPTLPGMENLSQYVAKNPGSGTVYTPASMTGGNSGLSNMVAQTAPYSGTAADLASTTGSGTVAGANSIDANQGALKTVISKLGGGGGGAGSLFAGLLSGFGLTSSFLPGTDETVQSDLLMKRIAFFRNYNSDKTISGASAGSNAAAFSKLGTVTSSLDALNAMVAAQSLGLVGGTSESLNNLMSGVANVSNLTPGMGLEGTVRATGAMQQASSVNMLRGIGIQLRDANGNLTAPDKVIDDVWTKICRDYSQAYGANKAPSLKEVQISLQPGNALDSMLTQYFGSDPMLKTMVMNGLIYRAQSNGKTLVDSTTADVTNLTSTAAINSLSQKTAAMTNLLAAPVPGGGTVASEGATGFTSANNIIKAFTDIGTGIAAALLAPKTLVDTLLSAGGGAPVNVISSIAALSGKAEGGPVQGGTAYIVGEKGPELFVPSVSGAIVPNDQIQPNQNKNSGTITGSSNNTYNFNINIPNANTPEVISALRKLLSDLETNKIVSES